MQKEPKALSCGGCSAIIFPFQARSHWFQGWRVFPYHTPRPQDEHLENQEVVDECVWKICIKDLLSATWYFWGNISDRIKLKAVWKMLEGSVFQRQAMKAEREGFVTVHCLSLFLTKARQKGRPYACLTNQTGSVVSHHAAGRKAGCPAGWEPSLSLPSGLTHHLADSLGNGACPAIQMYWLLLVQLENRNVSAAEPDGNFAISIWSSACNVNSLPWMPFLFLLVTPLAISIFPMSFSTSPYQFSTCHIFLFVLIDLFILLKLWCKSGAYT